ncbi:TPA: hypothetical protein ACRXTU_000241 [Pseudomonas aeruginosa]
MTDINKLRELAELCLSPADGETASESANLDALRRVYFRQEANPQAILAMLDEIDGMKASGWRNHSVNYARAEKCPQTLETAQAAWDRDQELIEEQRQQIARDSQTINQLRQKLQSAEVDRDRLKAENEALRKIISECATACGAGCAPECTLEFMSMLPGEISSVVSRRAAAEIGKSMGGGE